MLQSKKTIILIVLIAAVLVLGALTLPKIYDNEPVLEKSVIYVFNNPYKDVNWDTFNQYKANFHTHTTQSDGLHDPDFVIDAYHLAGYRILALTDHDHIGPGGEWPPTTEPTWPWSKWDRDPEKLNPKMLAVKGNEISSPHHHLSLFNEFGSPSTTIENSLDEIRKRNGLAVLSHPGRYTTQYTGKPYPEPLTDTWYLVLFANYYNAPLVGMEVYNLGDSYPDDRDLWDRLNAITMPEKAIFGYSVDDMHHKSHMFKNYQYMLMEELTETALKEAMLAGAFFFCHEPRGDGNAQTPMIERIEVQDGETVIRITAKNIDILKPTDSVTWLTEKGIAGFGFSMDLQEEELDGCVFIRAVLENEYGRTYTQPFVLSTKNI